MKIGPRGEFEITPAELFAEAKNNPVRLINDVLIRGTPFVFPTYRNYCDFLSAAGDALHVHPATLFVRGSSKIGFSISPRIPRPPKTIRVWNRLSEKSDIDLAIVDADLYYRIDGELQRWEQDNKATDFQGEAYEDYLERRQDRCFYYCREYRLPQVVGVAFRDAIQSIATEKFCDCKRTLSAFIFRDWFSLRRRYEYDLRQLCERVATGKLPPPPS